MLKFNSLSKSKGPLILSYGLAVLSIIAAAAISRPFRKFGTFQDITERKRADESLRERETLFKVLTENSYDLIRLHELDGRSIYASPAVVQLLGESQRTCSITSTRKISKRAGSGGNTS